MSRDISETASDQKSLRNRGPGASGRVAFLDRRAEHKGPAAASGPAGRRVSDRRYGPSADVRAARYGSDSLGDDAGKAGANLRLKLGRTTPSECPYRDCRAAPSRGRRTGRRWNDAVTRRFDPTCKFYSSRAIVRSLIWRLACAYV